MNYNMFKGTRLEVSELSLGTMMFGGQTEEAESLAIMNRAYERGINLFDTADVYNAGESERIVGKGLKGRREKIILATKVFNKVGEADFNNSGLSRRYLLKALDASLLRLDTDYVDIYYLHSPDYHTRLEETLETMTDIVKCGKVRYIGVSNFAAWQIADILSLCEKNGYIAPIVTQNVYNAIIRDIEGELIPCIQNHGINLTIYNPIAAGLLSGKHKRGKPTENTRFAWNKLYADRYWSEKNFTAVEDLEEIAVKNNISLLELALRWCVSRGEVVSVITGVSRLSQLEQNIASVEGGPLSAEVMSRCDEVWQNLAGRPFTYMR
ncbi:MAG: aldo/keto reductase [Treponema sp.]|jgi:aryl-alcohol dehydrogenase-like predicted oxidoreductase|nr:aldo/keto reductase [Treponema sp.]